MVVGSIGKRLSGKGSKWPVYTKTSPLVDACARPRTALKGSCWIFRGETSVKAYCHCNKATKDSGPSILPRQKSAKTSCDPQLLYFRRSSSASFCKESPSGSLRISICACHSVLCEQSLPQLLLSLLGPHFVGNLPLLLCQLLCLTCRDPEIFQVLSPFGEETQSWGQFG